MQVALTKKSSNSKVGPIPVTVSSKETCPAECPLYNSGCYASAGYYTRMHWDKVTSGERGKPWAEFCHQLAELPTGQLWRHNVSGDLPGVKPENPAVRAAMVSRLDEIKCDQLAKAASGTRGFTYTHYALTGHNRTVIQRMIADGFTVNISCDNVGELDHARSYDLPAVTIIPEDAEKVTYLGKHKIVRCPATVRDTNCKDCGLCAIPGRSFVIGFPSHGSQKKKVIPITEVK